MVKIREIWLRDFGNGFFWGGQADFFVGESLGLGFEVKEGEIKEWRFFR